MSKQTQRQAVERAYGEINTIDSTEVADLFRDMERLKELDKAARMLRKDIEFREAQMLKAVQALGGACKIGSYILQIVMKAPACRPAWKDFFVALAKRVGLDPDLEEKRVQDAVRAGLVDQPQLTISKIPTTVS
jgi:hypothetical protein